jgi:hypothetical protein
MFSIIGSGFGLYGYLPAIISLESKKVVLPEEYRLKVLSRPELRSFEQDILWVKNKSEALKKTTDLILALPPSNQYSLVMKIIKDANLKNVYLEKPIAPCFEKSAKVLDFLDSKKIKYIVNYSFLYLNLQSSFELLMSCEQNIDWKWTFMADHFNKNLTNWKRYHDLGGGVLRFYGIHIIAFLGFFGYSEVIDSTLFEDKNNEPFKWKARITGDGLPICNVFIDSKSNIDKFSLSNVKLGEIVSEKDPFNLLNNKLSQYDRRVPLLVKVLGDEAHSKEFLKLKYININRLWQLIEDSTNFVKNVK